MKYSLLINCLLAIALTLSCSGYLDDYPETQLSENEVYDSEEVLEAHIYGCYAGFTNTYNGYLGRMNEFLHTASGLLHWGRSRNTDNYLCNLRLTKYSTSTETNNCFASLYTAVNRCNRLLDALPSSPVDPGYKQEVEAEAKFLRAVLYFTLVRMYGDVPLILSAPESPEQVNAPRAPWYQVYAAILSDLEYAWQHMRDVNRQFQTTGDPGRPNRWAARSYQAAVYLQIGSLLSSPDDNFWDTSRPERNPDFSTCGIASASDAFHLALSVSRDVIQNGPYELCDNYATLFRWSSPEDYLLKERIFVLQVNAKVSQHSMLATYSLPDCPGGTLSTTTNVNAGRVRPDRWLFQVWCAAYGGTKGSLANNRNIYIRCQDPRLDATMIHTSYFKNDTQSNRSLYPSNTYVLYTDVTRAFPYLKKYLDPLYNNDSGNADFYMMRLAEMYLTAAEASASLSQAKDDSYWNDALAYVEVLHKRARESVSPASAQPSWNDGNHDFPDKDALIDAIIWEREFEMCGEGHEFFDTHRRGANFLRNHIAVPKNAYLAAWEQQTRYSETAPATVFSAYYNMQYYPTDPEDLRKSLLCAFPLTEMTYNTAIKADDTNDYYWQ